MGNQALESLEIGNSKTVRMRRLLLISNLGDSSLNRKNSTRNRKTKLACESFEHEGVHYKVNSKKSGIYKEIMFKIIEQMKIAREIHNRLLVVRFDLHSGNFSQGNEEISLFRKQIIQWVTRHYQTHSIGFVWAREQEKAKSQHYHLAIFIDGDKIRHPKRLLKEIRDKWEVKDPWNHHKPFVEKPAYFINSDEVFHDAVYRLSYLAKVRGKGYRPEQSKDYSTSRLRLKNDN